MKDINSERAEPSSPVTSQCLTSRSRGYPEATMKSIRKVMEQQDIKGRGHTFAREISIYQIWSFHCVSYLRDFDNFNFNLGHCFASSI